MEPAEVTDHYNPNASSPERRRIYPIWTAFCYERRRWNLKDTCVKKVFETCADAIGEYEHGSADVEVVNEAVFGMIKRDMHVIPGVQDEDDIERKAQWYLLDLYATVCKDVLDMLTYDKEAEQ